MVSKNFCVAPWKHATVGNNGVYRMCCYDTVRENQTVNNTTLTNFMNSDYLKNIRIKMLEDVRIPNCATCYEVEDMGHDSQRIHYNTTMMDPSDTHNATVPNLQYIELRLGNACNLKCIGCSPNASSSIAHEFKRIGWFNNPRQGVEFDVDSLSKEYDWSLNEDKLEFILHDLCSAKRITLVGGEPFLIPHLPNLLKKIPRNKTIVIFTNLTLFNDRLLNVLSEFQRVDMYFSIDGWENFNDIARYPSKWEIVWTNLHRIIAYCEKFNTFNFKIFSVINCVSIHHFDKLMAAVKELGIYHQLVIATFPNYIRLELLPETVKEELLVKFADTPAIVNALHGTRQLDINHELTTLKTLFKFRNISLPAELKFIDG